MKGSPLFPLLFLVFLALPAAAGSRAKPYKVGVLFWHESPNDKAAFEGVKEGFRLAGMEWEHQVVNVASRPERAEAVLRGWEEAEYDLVYAMGTSAALQAKRHVTRTPVVFTAVTDPVESGVVPSEEGSGRNLCGNSNRIDVADVMTVFKEAVPGLARLGVVYNRDNPVPFAEVVEAGRYFEREPGRSLKLIERWIKRPEDLPDAVRWVLSKGAQALWIPIDYNVYRHLEKVIEVTDRKKVPLVTTQHSAVEKQAVVGVAVDYRLLGMRSVILAEQVLRKGAEPGDLPVGRMKSYRVIVNLAAARRTGARVPLRLLAIADEILDRVGED
ncbi:MAG: ABC transporter substrate-binding protein [Planctomycetota bacterium]|jgi:putative ABC transport system substrate-binding protein